MREPWIVAGDPRAMPPPVCPFPAGSRAADEWWQGHQKLAVAAYMESCRHERSYQTATERANYGHDFDNPHGRCYCGVDRWNFAPGLTDDERWNRRAELVCPRVKGPIFYLDCFVYAALLGDRFPVNTFGPSTWDKIDHLRHRIKGNFDRTDIVTETKGQCPVDEPYWPGVPRPR